MQSCVQYSIVSPSSITQNHLHYLSSKTMHGALRHIWQTGRIRGRESVTSACLFLPARSSCKRAAASDELHASKCSDCSAHRTALFSCPQIGSFAHLLWRLFDPHTTISASIVFDYNYLLTKQEVPFQTKSNSLGPVQFKIVLFFFFLVARNATGMCMCVTRVTCRTPPPLSGNFMGDTGLTSKLFGDFQAQVWDL